MSDGNGHPYSWSALFNGYDEEAMERCPFPAIPSYLREHAYPDEFIGDGRVTHIWTQDRELSEAIADAALIDHIVGSPDEMLGDIDALLLARDDSVRHRVHAAAFLDAGIPIYIDKPLATSRAAAEELLASQRREGQIFTCSALRFAAELKLGPQRREAIGELTAIEAFSPKSWQRYSPHIIEPTIAMLPPGDQVAQTERQAGNGETCLQVLWDSGITTRLVTLGSSSIAPISFEVTGSGGSMSLTFVDSFSAFKTTLERFVAIVRGTAQPLPSEEVLRVVSLIEAGLPRR